MGFSNYSKINGNEPDSIEEVEFKDGAE